jgi:hypothetical protein
MAMDGVGMRVQGWGSSQNAEFEWKDRPVFLPKKSVLFFFSSFYPIQWLHKFSRL